MRVLLVITVVLQLIVTPNIYAAEGTDEPFTVHKEDPQNKTGSVFFSSTKKNEVLFKANVWGAVQFPGVHYMPLGTRFLDAISFAGGPIDMADDEDITLSSKSSTAHGETIRSLSIKKAMTSINYNPIVQPDDIIVVREDKLRSRTIFWVTIGTFIVTAATLGVLISQEQRR